MYKRQGAPDTARAYRPRAAEGQDTRNLTARVGHTWPTLLSCRANSRSGIPRLLVLKPVPTPVAIFGSSGVCIYVPASRHWLISYSLIHLT